MSSAIMAWAFWIAILVACGIGGGAIVGYLFADWRDKHERLNRIKRGESPIMGADIRCYECEGCGVLFVVPDDWDISATIDYLRRSGWTFGDDEEERDGRYLCGKCSIGHRINSSNLSKR